MGRYITWSGDVLARYPGLATISDSYAAQDSAFVFYAESELDGRLAGWFATPFSGNNLTARDLAIDLTYLKAVQPNDEARTAPVRQRLEAAIADLIEGRATMVTDSGDALASAGEPVYSTTMGYHPVFGMGGAEAFAVDSQQLLDEARERGDV